MTTLPPDPDNAFVARCLLAGNEGGPLAGTTFAVKDNISIAGLPFTAGHALFEDRLGESTATAVRRLLDAGATCIGVTTTDAGGFGATTPQTANPVLPGHVVGGSSGGSAAAVARGHCDIAVGTDTGGSVRIPAACTGLIGYKPSFGRVPNDGVWPLTPELDHVGLIASDPDLLARAGYALLESEAARTGTETSFPAIGIEVDRKGAWHPVVSATVDRAVRNLERAGYSTVPVEVPDRTAIADAHGVIVLSEAARIYRNCSDPELLRLGEAAQRALRHAGAVTDQMIADARRTVAELLSWRDSLFATCDLLASPTLPVPVPRAGDARVLFAGRERPVIVPMTYMTCLANLTGDPVISLPGCAGTRQEIASLQFMGPGGSDEILLAHATLLLTALKGEAS